MDGHKFMKLLLSCQKGFKGLDPAKTVYAIPLRTSEQVKQITHPLHCHPLKYNLNYPKMESYAK